MKARRDFEVTEFAAMPQDSAATIQVTANADLLDCMERFSLFVGTSCYATCASAKRLSDFAFENGAQSVKHAYDLKLSDGEA